MTTYTYTAVSTDLTGGGWMRESTRLAHQLRTGGLCGLCGKLVKAGQGQIAHMTPRCRGGMNGPQNTLYACATCNSRMGTKTLDEYCATLPKKGAEIYLRAAMLLAQPLPRKAALALAKTRKANRVRALRALGTHTAKSVLNLL